jgi:hypothetical protein
VAWELFEPPFWKTHKAWSLIIPGLGVTVAFVGVLVTHLPKGGDGTPKGTAPVLDIYDASLDRPSAGTFRLRLSVQNVGNRTLHGCTGNEQQVNSDGEPNRYLPTYFTADPALWSLEPGERHIDEYVTSYESPVSSRWLYIEAWIGCETRFFTDLWLAE